jgi:diphosphomevalonate decarboxylase
MHETMERSPFYRAWRSVAATSFCEMKEALEVRDTKRLFELVERNSLAMHASAMAAGVVYMRDVTQNLLACVREQRRRGFVACATSDAGPHVKVLVETRDVKEARVALEAVPGVLRVIEARVGGGARLAS